MLPLLLAFQAPPAQPTRAPITFAALVHEMEDMESRARAPDPPYQALRATSYNRASVAKDEPGWFADSDGIGFIREETNGDRHEWVIQEQSGPGCLTKFWTPYFYYDLSDHVGPIVRVYLDGASEPLLSMPLIELVTGNTWPASYGPAPERQGPLRPFGRYGGFTARAGNLYLPIPFAKGCKITLDKKPFYFSIDSRAYPPGTAVRSATLAELQKELDRDREDSARSFPGWFPEHEKTTTREARLAPGERCVVTLDGPAAIRKLHIEPDRVELLGHTELFRQLVLRVRFDGEECIWCPLGDLNADLDLTMPTSLRRAQEWSGDSSTLVSFCMPFRQSAEFELLDLGDIAAHAKLMLETIPWTWDARSMHFHATWRPDDVVAGDHFEDWNFLDVTGEGVFVGDQWTVLNLTDGWWGEGDEKIYVDDSVARGFPDHFGTGSEDYYGWAGGVNPTRADVFSQPFLANISVGSTEHDSTRGFNILARYRGLDAIPFRSRFVFDMEASPGVDQRNPWNLLGYSSVCFWYGKPGAKATRGADPEAAKKPLMSLEELEARSRELEKQARARR